MMYKRWLSYICVALLWKSFMLANVAIGDAAPSFTATTIVGDPFSSASYKGRVVVLEWVAPKSPYVMKYYSKSTSDGVGYMQSLQKRFMQPPADVVWISIAPSPVGSQEYLSKEEWVMKLADWGSHPTAMILDSSGNISALYGVTTMPEVCVIDRSGRLVYRGAVDSLRGDLPSDIERITNIHWFESAIDNAVRGRPIYTAETIPYGMRIETKNDHSFFF